jgi:hypothetical protein
VAVAGLEPPVAKPVPTDVDEVPPVFAVEPPALERPVAPPVWDDDPPIGAAPLPSSEEPPQPKLKRLMMTLNETTRLTVVRNRIFDNGIAVLVSPHPVRDFMMVPSRLAIATGPS